MRGEVAVRVFGGSKIPYKVLEEIWTIADEENNGWLSGTGTAKAIRLIGHAQSGAEASPALLSEPGPLAKSEGYVYAAEFSPPPGFPPHLPEDKSKFYDIFADSNTANGLLSAKDARDQFYKSNLSSDQLSRIWDLADTQSRGALDLPDFVIAMYFISGLRRYQISSLSEALPLGLHEQATGLTSNGSFSSYTNRRQLSIPDQTDPTSIHPLGEAPIVQGDRKNDWEIGPNEKVEADAIFEKELDVWNVGFIKGDVAAPFMFQSNLPSEDLAHIWSASLRRISRPLFDLKAGIWLT